MPSLLRTGLVDTLSMRSTACYMDPTYWEDIRGLIADLTIFMTTEAEAKRLFQGRSVDVWGIAADSDGRALIAVSDYLGSVARIDGQTVALWTNASGTNGAHGVIVRPDGRVFVSVTTDLQCKIVEVDRKTHGVTEIVSMPRQDEWTFGMLAVEADGRLIFGNAAPTSNVYRVDVDARTIVPVAEGKELERVWGVAVGPGKPA